MSQMEGRNTMGDGDAQAHGNAGGGAVEQQAKRFKLTKQEVIMNIASSIDDIAKTMKSVGESYSDMLRINKMVVLHLRDTKKLEEELNVDYTEIMQETSR